jgi:hypothetical protein
MVKFGEIDASQILENEFRLSVLERIVEFNANNGRYPDENEMRKIKEKVVDKLQDKYPNSGIQLEDG